MTNSFASKFNYFKFLDFEYKPDSRTLAFRYSLGSELELTETLKINGNFELCSPTEELLIRAMHLAHLALGVSYFKSIGFKPLQACVTAAEVTFFEKLYKHGLGEYAYINKLSNFTDLKFETTETNLAALDLPDYCNKTVIPLGGGKDSLVTTELLNNKIENLYLFALARPGQEDFYQRIADIAKLPLITVSRHIDPKISEINKSGAYNGHVPFSSILAFSLLALAPILGIKTAVLSNEHSANFGNLNWSQLEINHQYSKSLEFESDFIKFNSDHGLKGFNYFSILRPLTEISIVKKFSESNKYDHVFTSCNRFFAKHQKLWCGECAKCCFFFLLAAAFYPKERLSSILGKNLFEDPKLFSTFDELCGLSGQKPFDCVGVPEESLLAAILASEKSDWSNSPYLTYLHKNYPQISAEKERLLKLAFSNSAEHNIPVKFKALFDGYFNCR